MRKFLLAIFCLFVSSSIMAQPTSLPSLKGVLLEAFAVTASFDIPAVQVSNCDTNPVGDDWVLNRCDIAMPLIINHTNGQEYFVFDTLIIVSKRGADGVRMDDYEYHGRWQVSSKLRDNGIDSTVKLFLHNRADKPTDFYGSLNLVKYDLNIAIQAQLR